MLRDTGHANGFKTFIAPRGALGFTLARELEPAAVTLDLRLPDMGGWRVLRRLKQDLATRHIPVQVISVEPAGEEAVRHGARGAIGKPTDAASLNAALSEMRRFVDRSAKDLLLVGGDDETRRLLVETIGNGDVHTSSMADAVATSAQLEAKGSDCVLAVFESEAESEGLLTLVKQCAARSVPFIAYQTEKIATPTRLRLGELRRAGLIRIVSSFDEVFDETARVLHRRIARLPDAKRRLLERLYAMSEPLRGRSVLIVDDDIRNIFAMTSLLESHGMDVRSAETGSDALRALREEPRVDVVLMDIMLPEMDGYETMRSIREISELRDIPIVALTAKAMKGDRERCMEAGASDYLSKPVETGRLLSTLRLWLTPEKGSDDE